MVGFFRNFSKPDKCWIVNVSGASLNGRLPAAALIGPDGIEKTARGRRNHSMIRREKTNQTDGDSGLLLPHVDF